MIRTLDDKGRKALLKEGNEMAEKLCPYFISGFTVENRGYIITPEQLFSGKVSEEPCQMISRDEKMKFQDY